MISNYSHLLTLYSTRFCTLLFSLFLCIVSQSTATDDISYYTSHRVGDTVITYGDDTRYTARFYAFVDEISCYTCMQTLANIAKQLAKAEEIQIVLFMKTRNTAVIERFTKDFEWKLPVVHDIATAYHQLYGVQNGPLCMLTDAKGVIYFMDIPGKATFDVDALNKALVDIDTASNTTNRDTTNQLEVVERFPLLLKDGTPLREWRAYLGTYIAGRDNFFLWDVFTHETVLIDRRGVVLFKRILGKLPKEDHGARSLVPIFLGGQIDGESIPFINLNWDFTSTLYRLHFDSNTLERMWDIPVDTTMHYASNRGLQLSDTSFLFAYDYRDGESMLDNSTLYKTRVVNAQGKPTTAFGRYEPYHQTIECIRSFALQSYCLGVDGSIYMAENFSDTIRVYSQTGALLRQIACAYDSAYWDHAWQKRLLPLRTDSPVDELEKVIDEKFVCIAERDGLLYDDEKRELYVVYQNRHTAPTGGLVYRFFLHRPEKIKKTIQHDLPLPEDCKPIYINNGLMYCIEVIRGISNLTVYKIPEWL